MEELADHIFTHGDVNSALRRLVQKGLSGKSGQSMPGIEKMLQSIQQRKRETLEHYNLDHIMDDLKERLRDIVDTERRGIERRLSEARARGFDESNPEGSGVREHLLQLLESMAEERLRTLDELPDSLGQRLKALTSYDFMDDAARAKFDRLLEEMRQSFLESMAQSLAGNLNDMNAAKSKSAGEMLRDLNQLLEAHAEGGEEASWSLFDRFMQKYGGNFGSNPPASPEELVESLVRQAGAMQSLMNALSPEMRQELTDAFASAIQDDSFRDELAMLAENLRELWRDRRTQRDWEFSGDEPLGLEPALRVMEELQKLEELERQLKRTRQNNRLDSVDSDLLSEFLGEEAAQGLEQLKRIADVLEEAGYLSRMEGRFELTPRGARKIGHHALGQIFSYIRKDRLGEHSSQRNGTGSEVEEATKPYEFGEPFNINLNRTVMNAVRRNPGTPVRLDPEDFEIQRTEHRTNVATVLMLDLSLSMVMRGNFQAAKKVALALDNLIRTRFPRDSLHIVGFSTYAREVKPEKLASLSWDELDPYTNIQDGLCAARKMLNTRHGCNKQIIVVSDGEPTAHTENGRLYLQYPPSPRTIAETLKEVERCTRSEIRINTFMLEQSPQLADFVDRMTRINRGRVFYTGPERLGHYMLVDYLSNRKRLLV